ncbi:hypothetical protein KHS38_14105 [Mucilaginibacter sp. Bleaf8]|uniref:hypothetical protein n=1 Tax=Mucilaginibacter sp. Bleaf8 TaxID=2834430 RepID=UPI001BCE4CFF|nr:hypothetical protein [Mucilaginibacter sp. Bleaf8]MBS7565542.1 hypothetical protein [Mucilaginibacter sp. Bleaf8]
MVIAVSASAFTTPKAATSSVSYKWFSISGSYSLTAAPRAADAMYLGEGTTAPDEGCPNTTVHQCVSGFNASQVNSSNQLINNSQLPQATPETKD